MHNTPTILPGAIVDGREPFVVGGAASSKPEDSGSRIHQSRLAEKIEFFGKRSEDLSRKIEENPSAGFKICGNS